jgi:ABC-type multidrug transport system fused ATPase/permease subunit
VFSLIERFYEPDSGTVRVDGTDTRDWPLSELRAAIGYVEQDAPVLSGTLRENLTFGAPGTTEEELADVLRTTRLVLDEATSQLDAINEAALRETVAGVAQLISVLVVAHRLSTVTMADQIIVMDSGRVQAVGTHTGLVAASPLYAELAATQFLAAGGVAERPGTGPL